MQESPIDSPWRDGTLDLRLRQMWEAGVSSNKIAAQLTAETRTNLTKNSIISRAKRLKLTRRGSPIQRVDPSIMEALPDLWKNGTSVRGIVRLLGVNSSTVYNYVRRLGLPERQHHQRHNFYRKKPLSALNNQGQKISFKPMPKRASAARPLSRAFPSLNSGSLDGLFDDPSEPTFLVRRIRSAPAPRPDPKRKIDCAKTCQMPLWGDDTITHQYCGKPSIVGSSYCQECYDRCYQAGTATTKIDPAPHWVKNW